MKIFEKLLKFISPENLVAKLTYTPVVPFKLSQERSKGKGFFHKGQEYVHHSHLGINQTAFKRFSINQITTIILSFILIALFAFLSWHLTLIIFISALTLVYFADFIFNLILIIRSFSSPAEIDIKNRELLSLDPKKLPLYTIFCPLYKEWKVLPQFIEAMKKLDYPKNKLQIMLILEENDRETIQQVKNHNLPNFFDVVIVPNSKPKTKPKAMNYALKYARGEYVVIYDAEDIPDPLQLKKVVLAFGKSNRSVACVQAKLNFYNPNQNLLTKLFTAEYSLWFDLVLTGLHSMSAPIPLGGTSNHFPVKLLKELKGWDSFNVTEDCDLGIRLAKNGYHTAIVNSLTLEEANSSVGNWFGQRTRWIKGYIQTYLVHMRGFEKGNKHWGALHIGAFQLLVGGKVMSMCINLLMWIITLSYFIFRPFTGEFIESLFPTPVFYMAVVSLIFGNFCYLYYYMIGCKKHGHDELTKYMVFVPFYWLIMSFAAWKAIYQFITAPHYWSKTKHGLHLKSGETAEFSESKKILLRPKLKYANL